MDLMIHRVPTITAATTTAAIGYIVQVVFLVRFHRVVTIRIVVVVVAVSIYIAATATVIII